MMHLESYSPYPTGSMNMSSAVDVMDGVSYHNPYRPTWRCAPPPTHAFGPLDDQLLARANEMSKSSIHPFFRSHHDPSTPSPSLYDISPSSGGHLRPAHHQLSSHMHSYIPQTHQHHQTQHHDTPTTPVPLHPHSSSSNGLCSTPGPSANSSASLMTTGCLPSISVASGFDPMPQHHQQQENTYSVGSYPGYSSAVAAAVAAANSAAAAAQHHNAHAHYHNHPLSGPLSPSASVGGHYDSMTHHHPLHEMDYDPRELEAFAERFKQRRIKLGVTQADVGKALGNLKLTGVGSLSQSTICRFESLTLSHNNMVALKPVLQAWLEEAEMIAAETAKNPDVYGDCGDKKRKRTSITDAEKRSLEAYFAVQPRPSSEKIAQIAEKLNLKKNVVRVWFCNQRQKQKRMKFTNVIGLNHHGQVM